MPNEKTRAELQETIDDLRERLNESRANEAPTVERVPEAEALATCIRAIDRLENTRNPSNTNYMYGGRQPQTATERVLRSLASKYAVELFKTEIREQPCSRSHLDEVSPERVMFALRSVNKPDYL